MLSALFAHVRRHAVGYLALFVALGGTSYAAFRLPRGSVGGRQIRNHAIDPVKLNPRFINGNVRAWAVVTASGRVVGGGGKPKVEAPVTPGVYQITWGVRLKPVCAESATIDITGSPTTEVITLPGNATEAVTAGYAVTELYSHGRGRFNNQTTVHTFDQSGVLRPLSFDVEVVC